MATWWPQLNGWQVWGIGALLIAVFAYTNIRGLNIIAISSVIFTVIIVAPFLVLIVLGFTHWHGTPWQPFVPPGQSIWSSLNYGLAIGVWMYSGYDSMSTLAGEIEQPRRIIPRALMIAMPIIVALYFLPTLAGLAGVGEWADWTTSGGTSFVEVARRWAAPCSATSCSGRRSSATWRCIRTTSPAARARPTRWPRTGCCRGCSRRRTRSTARRTSPSCSWPA